LRKMLARRRLMNQLTVVICIENDEHDPTVPRDSSVRATLRQDETLPRKGHNLSACPRSSSTIPLAWARNEASALQRHWISPSWVSSCSLREDAPNASVWQR
jgi:hypothetical protein